MSGTLTYIRSFTLAWPRVGVVLGSGLGAFADELTNPIAMSYADIPGWPQSTAVGHAGKLVVGSLEGLDTYQQGGLVLISDHINLQGTNPLIGPNDDSLGPRFPDMSDAYCAAYRTIARQVASELGIDLPEGVYAAVSGPSYETPAEIRYLRVIGADLVGMSTVPEVIVANHLGLKCLAISCVTNMAAGFTAQKINHQEVLETSLRVRGTLVNLLKALLPRIADA